jgi:hypothetical protein
MIESKNGVSSILKKHTPKAAKNYMWRRVERSEREDTLSNFCIPFYPRISLLYPQQAAVVVSICRVVVIVIVIVRS